MALQTTVLQRLLGIERAPTLSPSQVARHRAPVLHPVEAFALVGTLVQRKVVATETGSEALSYAQR